jgi:hypothetical protein
MLRFIDLGPTKDFFRSTEIAVNESHAGSRMRMDGIHSTPTLFFV